MKIKEICYMVKPPCNKCPYKLGTIQTLMNPCPQCKLNNYQIYELIKKQLMENDLNLNVKNEK